MPLRVKRNPKRKPTTIEYIQVMRKRQGGEDRDGRGAGSGRVELYPYPYPFSKVIPIPIPIPIGF